MASSRSSSNPSSAFDLLAEPVRRWIWDQGWTELRDIQERAILALLKGNRDLIIAAPTAGGKTEAAFLPLISSVLAAPGAGGFDLVYVAPLRALINDQLGRMEDLCARAGLPIYPWHGAYQGVNTRGACTRRVADLSVARRHISRGEVPRPQGPAGRAVDHTGVSGSSFRAARTGSPDNVLRCPRNYHRRTPCPFGQ